MDEAEREFLEATMERLDLSEEEMDRVRHFEGADGAEDVVAEMPLERREALRDDLLSATLADGRINDREREIVERLSAKLDL
jgi:hypothetical protein